MRAVPPHLEELGAGLVDGEDHDAVPASQPCEQDYDLICCHAVQARRRLIEQHDRCQQRRGRLQNHPEF